MKIRNTIIAGFLFLIPVTAIFLLLNKVLGVLHKLVDPIASKLPEGSFLGVRATNLLALGCLFVIAYLVGLYSKTSMARRHVRQLEEKVLLRVPGYGLIKSISQSLLGADAEEEGYQPVLVRFDDAWQIGLQADEVVNDHVAVFFPDVPTPQSGSVLLVSSERVIPANVPLGAVMRSLKRFGSGSAPLLEAIPKDKLLPAESE